MSIMNELKTRGVQDMLLAAVDGLTGFPEAIAAVFPQTEVQLCMVHMVRNPVRFVPHKHRKAVVAGLKAICLAPSAELAAGVLDEFASVWDTKYPMIARSWRSRWNEVIPFFKFSPEIRKAVWWDKGGFWLSQKRLERERWPWPADERAVEELSSEQLGMLLSGIDFWRAHKPLKYQRVS
jgi:transposase-like protein